MYFEQNTHSVMYMDAYGHVDLPISQASALAVGCRKDGKVQMGECDFAPPRKAILLNATSCCFILQHGRMDVYRRFDAIAAWTLQKEKT